MAALLASDLITWLILLGIGVSTGLVLGLKIGAVKEQNRAIEAGAGRWQIDAVTGRAHFSYQQDTP